VNVTRILAGVSTWFGILGAVSMVALGAIEPLQESLEPIGVDPSVYTIAGSVLGALVIVGRQGQAMVVAARQGMSDGERKARADAIASSGDESAG
jgi:hypothetical protein